MQNSIKEYVLSGEFEQVRQLMAKADFLDFEEFSTFHVHMKMKA